MRALADGGGDADALQMIGSIIVRAHHCAADAKAGRAARVLDARAVAFRPISISAPVPTPGEAHDSTAYGELMEERESDPDIPLADRGYDSDAIR